MAAILILMFLQDSRIENFENPSGYFVLGFEKGEELVHRYLFLENFFLAELAARCYQVSEE